MAGIDWSRTRPQVDDKAKESWMLKYLKDWVEFIVNGELHDEIIEFSNTVSDGLFGLLIEFQHALRDFYIEHIWKGLLRMSSRNV